MNGISFIIRVRNEQDTLQECLRSLAKIYIPHEIIVILNNCDDGSESIAKTELAFSKNTKIVQYNYNLSRPGYETLCTDAISSHSFINFCNYGLSLSDFPWRFTWDADFIMTDNCANYINNYVWEKTLRPRMFYFEAKDNDGIINTEGYLMSDHFYYDKYWFWEVKQSPIPAVHENTQLQILHNSSLSKRKKYWDESPWFENEKSSEAEVVRDRMRQLESICGPEPRAQARASNPLSPAVEINVINHEQELRDIGISPVGGWEIIEDHNL